MKVKDGICGFIVGDALGVPFEFRPRECFIDNPVTDMVGYGTYNMPAGTWSDDSSMTLATMQSITDKKAIDYEDIMNEFCNWRYECKYTQYDDVFDIGIRTSKSLSSYKSGTEALRCGGDGERDNGNGSLMRILPLAYLQDISYETVENVSSLTHAHEISKISCTLYVEIAKSMLENELSIDEHIKNACDRIKEHYKSSTKLHHFDRIFNDDLSDVESSGYVIKTLECVLHCLKTTDNYKDAVLKAVNFGNDTDTTAAICGGLAGIYYGFECIPIDWLNQIEKIDEVYELCEKFEVVINECS